MEGQEINRIENKMAEIVARWKDKPEPAEKSADWFRRRVDRSLYVSLRAKLKKLRNGQEKLMSVEEQLKTAKSIGLI